MSTSASPAPDQIRSAIQKANDLFNSEVFAKKNFNALDEIYTKDARILPPGSAMISGRENIKGFWANLITSTNASAAVLTSEDVIVDGQGAIEIGRGVLTVAPQGQTTQMEAKYVVYWRQEDGKWKWHVDIWNANS